MKECLLISMLLFSGIIFFCMTPTHRHEKCLELILEGGANVNNVDKEGSPVFVVACDLADENEKLCLELLKEVQSQTVNKK